VTLTERADSYAAAFPQYPASHLRVVQEQGGDCLYGTWLIGNDYRNKTAYYGAYPAGYLQRLQGVFPDWDEVLHVFSGSLPRGPYDRCDLRQDAEYQCSVTELPQRAGNRRWRLAIADPPYTAADAHEYGTPMVDRRAATAALARVTKPGGFLVWLDCVWPMFRKTEWRTVARICLIRSTNHRVRLVSIFERQAA
jgi:hypothetical protein